MAHICRRNVRMSCQQSCRAAHNILPTPDEADLNLSKRTKFPWTVLRPSSLLDEPSGGISLAERGTISTGVPRETVGKVLLALAELPPNTKGADGKMWDLTQGKGDIRTQVDEAVKRARTDWVG